MDQEIDAGKVGELKCVNQPVYSDAQNVNYFQCWKLKNITTQLHTTWIKFCSYVV